jgi:hypothetical protein
MSTELEASPRWSPVYTESRNEKRTGQHLGKRDIEPHPLLFAGQRARICRGALEGMGGVAVWRLKNSRVVLTMQRMATEVDENDLALGK